MGLCNCGVLVDKQHLHRACLVAPVYRGCGDAAYAGERGRAFEQPTKNAFGNGFVFCKVLLVYDCGLKRSDLTIEQLNTQYTFVQPV